MESAGTRTKCTAEGNEWVRRAVKRISSLSDVYSKGRKKKRKPLQLNMFGESRSDA